MLKILLKKQLSEIFRSYFYDAKKNKARSRLATCAYMVFFVVLMVGVLGGLFTYLSLSICRPLAEAGMGWLYFALMGLLAIFLGVFGSVFNTYAALYQPGDNEMLLSMPIPPTTLLLSRLLLTYGMSLQYSALVWLPAVLCAWLHGPVWIQLLWFVLVSAAALYLCRPLVAKYVNSRGQATNADRYLHLRGIVTETIDNAASKGSVKIEGRLWTARSADGSIIPKGSIVAAREIRGVKLIVEEVNQNTISGR